MQHLHGDEVHKDCRETRGNEVATIQRTHRIERAAAAGQQQTNARGYQTKGADDEREEDPSRVLRASSREDCHAKDHRADVFGRGRFEEISTTPSAVTDVVSHQVGDHRSVTGIILGDVRFDLADEVGAHVGSLGVDTAAKLREESDEASAEAEANDLKRSELRVSQTTIQGEDRRYAQQAQ